MPVPAIQSGQSEDRFLVEGNRLEDRPNQPHLAAPGINRDEEARPPQRLTPVQLTRLRSHLDSLLLSIQRRYTKRFEPDDGSVETLDTLQKYLLEWQARVLPLVARIDPVGAEQTTTAKAYAMNAADAICQGIAGYPLASEQGGADTSVQAVPAMLFATLTLLNLLDALWSALLVGRSLQFESAVIRARARLQETTPAQRPTNASLRDSKPLQGSLGIRTASVTDRVRLRNLLVTRKEDLKQWLAQQAGVAISEDSEGDEKDADTRRRKHPTEGTDAGRNITRAKRCREVKEQGERSKRFRELFDEQEDLDAGLRKDEIREDAESVGNNDDDDGEDGDREKVDISISTIKLQDQQSDSGRGGTAQDLEDNEERRNFRHLFERKLDPDEESDGDEDEDRREATTSSSLIANSTSSAGTEANCHLGEATPRPLVASTRMLLGPSNDSGARKICQGDRNRHSEDDAAAVILPQDPLQVEALGSRLFSRTLALLEHLNSLD